MISLPACLDRFARALRERLAPPQDAPRCPRCGSFLVRRQTHRLQLMHIHNGCVWADKELPERIAVIQPGAEPDARA